MWGSRDNPYRHRTPPGWRSMESAPRDGTMIEIQNNWGVAPWFGRFRWNDEDGRWRQVGSEVFNEEGRLIQWSACDADGDWLSWRPAPQHDGVYVDPTGGAQFTSEYWLQACGIPAPKPEPVEEEPTPAQTAAVVVDEPVRPWWKIW